MPWEGADIRIVSGFLWRAEVEDVLCFQIDHRNKGHDFRKIRNVTFFRLGVVEHLEGSLSHNLSLARLGSELGLGVLQPADGIDLHLAGSFDDFAGLPVSLGFVFLTCNAQPHAPWFLPLI